LPYFDIYISEAVLDEIGATEELKLRKALENQIKINFTLFFTLNKSA
jgi:hypothetical protein